MPSRRRSAVVYADFAKTRARAPTHSRPTKGCPRRRYRATAPSRRCSRNAAHCSFFGFTPQYAPFLSRYTAVLRTSRRTQTLTMCFGTPSFARHPAFGGDFSGGGGTRH